MGDIRYRVTIDGLTDAATNAQKLDAALRGVKRTIYSLPKQQVGLATPISGFGGPGPSHILQSDRYFALAAKQLKGMGSVVPQGPSQRTLQSFFNQSVGIGAGQNRITGASARQSYQNFWKNAVPATPQPINWKQAGLGLAAAPFSPWIGARMMSNALGPALGGAFGGGAGGGAASAIFGAGGAGAFAAFYVALRTAGMLLKEFATHIHAAIEEGAKLYQESARTATNPGKLAHLDFMGQALGISPAEMRQLLVRGEHPLKGGGATLSTPEVDAIFGAGRGTQQIAVLQQLKNMSEDIRDAWRHTALAAKEFSETAKPLQGVHAHIAYMAAEWKTMWAQVATVLSPLINFELAKTEYILKALNFLLGSKIALLQALHIIPKGQPGSSIIPAGKQSAHVSGWERMGFVIGGFGGGNDYAKQTAQNTKKLVDIMRRALPRGAQSGMSGQLSYNAP